MAGGEDQAQQVVADVVVERGVEVGRGALAARSRARGRAPRACARPACRGAAGRWRGAWRRPSARRRGCRECPTPATARARRRARPAPAPRRGRRRAPCARGRRSASPARCARPRRWRDGCRSPSRPRITPSRHPTGASCAAPARQVARSVGPAWPAFRAHLRARGAPRERACSGVNTSSEKSSASKIGRSSHSPWPSTSRKRVVQWIGLVHRLHLEQGVGGDQLLGLGEGAVDDGDLAAGEPHALALGARLQAVARRASRRPW